MKNIKISKDTIVKILATREYQQFIKEWLNLYDRYFALNPKPFPQVKKDCEYTLLLGFFDKMKESYNNDELMDLYNTLERMKEEIQLIVNPYE